MENMSLTLKSLLTLSALFLFTAFVTCNNGQRESETGSASLVYSSVIFKNGNYKIDSTIAQSNGNKLKLLQRLEEEHLIEEKTVEEIPGFILSFLDSMSADQTFDLTDPDSEWQTRGRMSGIDDQHKSMVNAVSSVAGNFATKQLLFFGMGKNMVLLSFFTCGLQTTQHIAIMQIKDEKIIDLWFGDNGFDYNWLNGQSGFVTTKNEIIKYLKTRRNGNC